MKYHTELEELINFVKDKPYISTGFYKTQRGKELQITYHQLPGKSYSLWEKIKFCIIILFKT